MRFNIEEYTIPKVGHSLYEHHNGCSNTLVPEDKKGLWIVRSPQYVTFYCHCCNGKQSIKYTKLSGKLFYKETTTVQPIKTGVGFPEDYDINIPKEGLLWLFSYDITLEEIEKFKIGYSSYYTAIIFPIFDNGKLVYWQGRHLQFLTGQPKYYNPPKVTHPTIFFPSQNWAKDYILIIVEDIISAIKVSRSYNVICLLGTNLHKNYISVTIPYPKIYIWLDADAINKAQNMKKRLELFNSSNISIINTPKDPKCYSDKEIQRFMNETN